MIELRVHPKLQNPIGSSEIERLIEVAFQLTEKSPADFFVGIHLTTDEEIRGLNSQYRGFNKPTDVLSFEANEYDPENDLTYLGDIIVSIPTATQQANEAEHPVETEVLLLITHGFLHLIGYDHATSEQKSEMWQKQSEILNAAGVYPKQLPEI